MNLPGHSTCCDREGSPGWSDQRTSPHIQPPEQGQKLQQIVHRGSTSGAVPAREDAAGLGRREPGTGDREAGTGRRGHRPRRDPPVNKIGLACLDPRWAGGRPRLLNPDDEDFVVQTATTRPTKLGQPFTRWSIRKLAAYLRKVQGRVIRIGREALRCLLARRGVLCQVQRVEPELTTSEPNQGAAYGPRRSGGRIRVGHSSSSRSRTTAGATPIVRACRIAACQSLGATRIRFPSGSAARKVSPNPAS